MPRKTDTIPAAEAPALAEEKKKPAATTAKSKPVASPNGKSKATPPAPANGKAKAAATPPAAPAKNGARKAAAAPPVEEKPKRGTKASPVVPPVEEKPKRGVKASPAAPAVEEKPKRGEKKTAPVPQAPAGKASPASKAKPVVQEKPKRGEKPAAPAVTAAVDAVPTPPPSNDYEEVSAPINQGKTEYGASQIQQKSVLEAIRDLTAMYLGGVGMDALFQTYLEAVTNAADEVLAIGVKKGLVQIEFGKDFMSVTDNGRGIPVGTIKNANGEDAVITLKAIFTEFHTGGKFKKDAYLISGGMHGTGAKALAAFAKRLIVETNFGGYTYNWELRDGGTEDLPITVYDGRKKLAEIRTPAELIAFQKANPQKENRKHGTTVTFFPSPELLKVKPEQFVMEGERLREVMRMVCAAMGIRMEFTINGEKTEIHYKTPADYLAEKYGIASNMVQEFPLTTIKSDKSAFTGKLFLARYEGTGEMLSVINNLPVQNGRHITGLSKFVTDAVMSMMTKNTKVKITPSNILSQGLLAFIVLEGSGAAYSSQAKTELVSPDSNFFVELYNRSNLLKKQPFKDYLGQLYQDILDTLDQKALKKKSKATIYTKLANVKGNKYPPEDRDVFLVEGDSAGGTCRMGRDAERQAVFPLRGKIQNVYGIPASRVLGGAGSEGNVELRELNNMIVSDQFGRFVILSDADVDGKHIAVLIVLFFQQYHPTIIKQRRLLWLIPPLYGVITKGNEIQYARDDAELEAIRKSLGATPHSVQRYKGLGEMNEIQMKKVMVDEFEKYAVVLEMDEHTNGTIRFWFDSKEAEARNKNFMTVINGKLAAEQAAEED